MDDVPIDIFTGIYYTNTAAQYAENKKGGNNMTKLDILDFISKMDNALCAIDMLSDEAIAAYKEKSFDMFDYSRKAAFESARKQLKHFECGIRYGTDVADRGPVNEEE